MNEGICVEYYSHYWCDCAYTPYRGWVCGREVGVNMQPDYMIKYTFDEDSGNIATDEETIIRNDNEQKPEYITVELNNNGQSTGALSMEKFKGLSLAIYNHSW